MSLPDARADAKKSLDAVTQSPQLLLPGPTPRGSSKKPSSLNLERQVEELTAKLNETKSKYDAVLQALAGLVNELETAGFQAAKTFLQVYRDQLNLEFQTEGLPPA